MFFSTPLLTALFFLCISLTLITASPLDNDNTIMIKPHPMTEYAAHSALLSKRATPAPVEGLTEIKESGSIPADCDTADSTFINASSSGSPNVTDCQKLATEFLDYYFEIYHCIGNCKNGQTTKVGTCDIGFSCDGVYGADVCLVTRTTIQKLIDASIEKFEWKGLVGAEGHMGCPTVSGRTGYGTAWAIYHT